MKRKQNNVKKRKSTKKLRKSPTKGIEKSCKARQTFSGKINVSHVWTRSITPLLPAKLHVCLEKGNLLPREHRENCSHFPVYRLTCSHYTTDWRAIMFYRILLQRRAETKNLPKQRLYLSSCCSRTNILQILCRLS